MQDATRWMQMLGSLALVSPFLLGRMAVTRPYARRVSRVFAVLYLAVGVGFVVWWMLRKPDLLF